MNVPAAVTGVRLGSGLIRVSVFVFGPTSARRNSWVMIFDPVQPSTVPACLASASTYTSSGVPVSKTGSVVGLILAAGMTGQPSAAATSWPLARPSYWLRARSRAISESEPLQVGSAAASWQPGIASAGRL